MNVIAIDWSAGSRMYTQGLGNAPRCGAIIADFINFLIASRLQDVSLMRFVGVGLGAQVAGIAARNVMGNVPHIVGRLRVYICLLLCTRTELGTSYSQSTWLRCLIIDID